MNNLYINEDKELKGLVKRLFEILEETEVSEMTNREFHPTIINSCRVMRTDELNKMFKRMKEIVSI